MVSLEPGEKPYCSVTSIGKTLTGTPAQIIERLEEVNAASIDNFAIACTNAAGAPYDCGIWPRIRGQCSAA